MSLLVSYLRSTRAAVAVEFAFIMPALLVITIGTLDLTLALAEMHLNSEAARAAGRIAIIKNPLAEMVYNETSTVVCTGLTSTSYDGCGAGVSTDNNDEFAAIFKAALGTKPTLSPVNLSISYVPSGLDRAYASGSQVALATTPLVTVTISNNTYSPFFLSILPSIGDTIALPDVIVTRMSPSIITSLS